MILQRSRVKSTNEYIVRAMQANGEVSGRWGATHKEQLVDRWVKPESLGWGHLNITVLHDNMPSRIKLTMKYP